MRTGNGQNQVSPIKKRPKVEGEVGVGDEKVDFTLLGEVLLQLIQLEQSEAPFPLDV